MTFLNPLMLTGLGAAMVPLVLHLLARARYQRVAWGAMMFLESARRPPLSSSRVREGVILLIRMFAIASLATALARPVVGGVPGRRPARAIVILIDCSGSMGTEEAGQTRIDLARRVALQVVASLRQGDEAAVIPLGAPFETVRFSGDKTRLAAGLADIAAGAMKADIAEGLLVARRALAPLSGRHRSVVLVTDRQASSWRGVDDRYIAEWSAALEPLDLIHFPVGGEAEENLAIESIGVTGPPPMFDAASRVAVRVRNFSKVDRANVPLTLYLLQREVRRTAISIAANSSATVSFPVQFGTRPVQTITSQIQSGTVAFDDQRSQVVDVSSRLNVLVVSGGIGDASDATTRHLVAALAPYEQENHGAMNRFSVRVVALHRFTVPSVTDTPLIVLADCPPLSQETLRDLNHYVYTGGGLLIAPGSRSDFLSPVDGANEGQEFFPAQPAMPAENLSPMTISIDGDPAHRAATYMSRETGDSIRISRRFDFGRLQDGVSVVASTERGTPFCIEWSAGWGHVAMTAIPLDMSWSDFPSSRSFLPFVQSVARYLATPGKSERNVAIGQAVTVQIPDGTNDVATLVRPDDSRVAVDVVRARDVPEVRITDTSLAGRYEIRYSADRDIRVAPFVVRWPMEESDPAVIEDTQLDALAKLIAMRRIDVDAGSSTLKETIDAAISGERAVREATLPLLIVFVALLVGETMLVRRWSAGDS